MNAEENEIAKYFKKYLMSMNSTLLKKFLRFCTGSDLMPNEQIKITMVKRDGLARRPVAHTCGNVLELPISYTDYPEFRSEFNSVLDSAIWVMDIA